MKQKKRKAKEVSGLFPDNGSGPRGGMADAGDLKSPLQYWGCGFESHRGQSHCLAVRRITSQAAKTCRKGQNRRARGSSQLLESSSHYFALLLLPVLLTLKSYLPCQ